MNVLLLLLSSLSRPLKFETLLLLLLLRLFSGIPELLSFYDPIIGEGTLMYDDFLFPFSVASVGRRILFAPALFIEDI